MLKLKAPQKSTAQLRALAASGSTGLARKAQAELTRRVSDQLRAEMANQQGAR